MTTKTRTVSLAEDYSHPQEYWEKRLKHNFSLGGVGHGLFGFQYNCWLYRVRDRVLRRQLATLPLNLSDIQILDVGSGTGFYIDFWEKMGAGEISGCDLTDISVQRLQEKFPTRKFHRLDISGELSSDLLSKFDVVSAFDVLFHIVDDEKFESAFRNISSLLKAGGLFCFSELFLHGDTEASSHIVRRSLSHIQRVLSQAGFEIILRRPVFVLMNEPLDTRSKLSRLAWALMTYPVRWSETIGWLYGATLYPIDLILTRFLHESPTTEMMICRKVR